MARTLEEWYTELKLETGFLMEEYWSGVEDVLADWTQWKKLADVKEARLYEEIERLRYEIDELEERITYCEGP